MDDYLNTRRPIHLWVVGVVSLLWNAVGASDFVFSNMRSDWWFEAMQYPEAGIAYLDAFPTWAVIAWGCGTLGAFIGSILLLLRTSAAVWAFAVSLAGIAVTTVYEMQVELPAEMAGIQPGWFPIILWSIATFLLIYAISMRSKGVLR
ncbi:MAG: hypothetical protein GW855_04820 [Erythrobacter sp.]|nr:hypothetical protein [Erythrobacter sp.]NCQ63761.1 hypothetical protein [Alphaproteobacteria bacterium]